MEPTPLQIALIPSGKKRDLAAACSVKPASVSAWVKKGWVPGRHARRAAEFLAISVEQILEKSI